MLRLSRDVGSIGKENVDFHAGQRRSRARRFAVHRRQTSSSAERPTGSPASSTHGARGGQALIDLNLNSYGVVLAASAERLELGPGQTWG